MMKFRFHAGIDWGSASHQGCIVDGEGRVVAERAFSHDGSGLAELADWLLARAEGDPHAVGVAIEVPRGPVVETLMDRGIAVHSINPKQLDRFRDRLSPAGAKDDRRDARVLADALRTDARALRHLEPTMPEIVELREWSRIAADLSGSRTRLMNRVGGLLWRYYPQFAKVESDLSKAWVRELWQLAPTPARARRIRVATVAGILKRHRVRRIDAAAVLQILRAREVAAAPGVTEAATAHIALLFAQLALTAGQLATAHGAIDRLTEALSRPAAADEEEEAGTDMQRDVEILRSMPGIGRLVLATLLAEGHDALRRRDYHALRCMSGVAPVTRQSGKGVRVSRRLAAHNRLRDAAYHWARVAVQHDPVSKQKYAALRARGHAHARSLRGVADRLLGVACVMLENQTDFNPDRRTQAHAA